MRFTVPHELFPVEHRFVDLDGTRIHYIDEGSGEILLLLHGNPSWSFLYRKIIAGLKGQYRCIALDFPGYGLSDAPEGYGFTPREHADVLERFVDRLGLTGVTMMVQDWGGPIGLGLAARHPELVRRLVIGNTFAWPLVEIRLRVFSWLMGGPIGSALTAMFNFVPRFFFSKGLARRVAPQVMAMYMAPWADPSRRRAAVIAPRQLIRAAAYLREVEAGLHLLRDLPALIIWGKDDFAFGTPERERFERLFANHRTIVLERASHFLQEDAGEEIVAAFLAWGDKS